MDGKTHELVPAQLSDWLSASCTATATLWRWHAFRIHQAAGWLAGDLLRSGVVGAAAPAPVWPGAPSVGDVPRFSAHAPLGLADLGTAGR